MDRTACRDQLYGFATTQWASASLAVLGTEAVLRYGGIIADPIPPDDSYWARVTTQVVREDQETLRNGVRRFRTDGIISLQCFAPITDVNCVAYSDRLSELLRNSFRIYQGENMEFTNSRVSDNITPESNWLRFNVTSNFAYRQFL